MTPLAWRRERLAGSIVRAGCGEYTLHESLGLDAADWLERHPRRILIIVALMGILYGAAAWMAFRDRRHFMGVPVIFSGIGLCLSLLLMRRMLRESDQAWRERPEQDPSHRGERRGR